MSAIIDSDLQNRIDALRIKSDNWTRRANELFPGFDFISAYEWSGYLVVNAFRVGAAARRNRGSYSGQKVHRLYVGYIVGKVNTDAIDTDYIAWVTEPKLHSIGPVCGCTQGQHAGSVIPGKQNADINCTKCIAHSPALFGGHK